jgi:hypothetical protein
MDDLDFSNMNLIFHLNYMPRVCGIFQTTDSTAHAMYRLECRIATEEFKSFVRIASTENMFGKIKEKFLRIPS